MVVAERAFGTVGVHGSTSSQCGCCRPDSGHVVRGVSKRGTSD